MPNQESKMVPEEEAAPVDEGRQAAVEDATAEAASSSKEVASVAEGGSRSSGSSGSKPHDVMGKALAHLSPQQIQDLMARNPTLQQEVASSLGGDAAALTDSKEGQELARKKLIEMFKSMSLGDLMTGMSTGKNAKDMASYKFWKTQPVPSFDDDPKEDVAEGPFEAKTVEDVPTEPADLAQPGFEWVTVDITEPEQMKEVYTLLNGHYVEDASAQFRFDYSEELLTW